MKKIYLLLFGLILLSCQEQGVVVATEENGFITVNTKDLKDSILLPLSELIEDIEIIQLDSDLSHSAKFGQGYNFFLSENYLVVPDFKGKLMLFNRKSGKHICDIGDKGNGHGEYTSINDCCISEADKVIYLSAKGNEIYKYDLNGKFIGVVPLAKDTNNGLVLFKIDEKSKVITVSSTYKDMLWKQDFDGNEIAEISSLDENKTNTGGQMNDINGEVYISRPNFNNKPDTLCKINQANNTLQPVFVLNVNHLKELEGFNGDAHSKRYIVTPKHIITTIVEFKMVKNSISVNVLKGGIFVNKKNLTGGYFKLFNDFIGVNVATTTTYKDGYFATAFNDAVILKEKLENISDEQKADMSSATRKRIDNLLSSLDEEGNAVIMIGKLK
ncbi:MAG: 6-bladed beta-propeller [Rikenellaceae bacterium]